MGNVRQVLVVAIVAALAVGGYVYYDRFVQASTDPATGPGQRAPRIVAVEVAPAELVTLDTVLEAVGTTRALRSVDIVPHAEGRIVEIDITAGKEVTAGTVLARLDDEIEQATLTEAEATLEEKVGGLERFETLLLSNNVSRAAIDQARSELAIARADEERAKRRLDDRIVRAPFDGVLGITSVNLGARVDTSTILTSLDDLSAVEIEFRLPETVYSQIEQGQPVTATAAAFPDRVFTGTVAAIDSRIDQTSRAFAVRARLPNERRELPAGMFMRISLATGERDAVVVSEEAILVQGGDAYLFVAEDGKAVRKVITTGLRRDGMVEVETGIADGEAIISRGIQSLRDGARIEVIGSSQPSGAGGNTLPPAAGSRPPDAAIEPDRSPT